MVQVQFIMNRNGTGAVYYWQGQVQVQIIIDKGLYRYSLLLELTGIIDKDWYKLSLLKTAKNTIKEYNHMKPFALYCCIMTRAIISAVWICFFDRSKAYD